MSLAGPTRRSEVAGYYLYDFANSSFTTLISTVAYSVYFRQVVVGAADPRGDFLWSVAQVLAHAVLILTAPVLGALADYSGHKKRLLALTTAQTVAACVALALVGPGDVATGMLLLVVGLIGYEGGYVFYNAFLPEVSTPRTIGRVSGLSWGFGFLGGLAALLVCAPLLARPLVSADGGAIDAAAARDYRASFVVVALFFAVFGSLSLALLRERGAPRPGISARAYVVAGFGRVADTITHLRRYRETAKYVAAAACFHGAIETVIKFSAIYAAVSFGIRGAELVGLFVLTNVVAVPGTLAAGWLADRAGPRRALAATLVGWIVLVACGASIDGRTAFWALAAGIAVGMGSTQAIGRSLMAQVAPASRESEFFGFYLLASKIGSIGSLLLFGIVSGSTGNQRVAVLSILPFFAAGLGLLLWMDEGRARAAARGDSG